MFENFVIETIIKLTSLSKTNTIYMTSFSFRRQLEAHIHDDCPKTEVPCEFKNLGCSAVVWNIYFNISSIEQSLNGFQQFFKNPSF